jgi:hypothetical protein
MTDHRDRVAVVTGGAYGTSKLAVIGMTMTFAR